MRAPSKEAESARVERLVGEPVADATPAAWGFTNRTDIVTLATGERVVVQRYTDPAYEGEAQRIENLGAVRVSDNEQDAVRWTVFRYFRLFAPRPRPARWTGRPRGGEA